MADDQPFYSPTYKPPPARQARPREPVWTLKKSTGARVECSLLSHGEWGWDVLLFRDGGFYGSRRFQFHDEALRWAEAERQALKADGWAERE
jgi:hypothetical protein